MAVRSAERHRPETVEVVPAPAPATSAGEPSAAPAPVGAGDGRRVRRARRATVGLAALLVAAALAAAVRGDGGDDTRVTSASPGPEATSPSATETTAAPAAATTTAPAAAPTSAPAGAATRPPAPATTAAPAPGPATTAAPATTSCRNSADPACGPFRFDPQPAADRAMTLAVSTEPSVVTAGAEVVFRVVLEDPDGVDYNATLVEYGDGMGLGASAVRQCEKYGPWDPPAPGGRATVEVVEYRHVFQAPGTYTARFSFDAGPFDCTDSVTGVGDRPYASSAARELVVVVAPAP